MWGVTWSRDMGPMGFPRSQKRFRDQWWGTTPWPQPAGSAALVPQPEPGLQLEASLEVFKPSSSFPRPAGFPKESGVDVAVDSAPATSDSCSWSSPWRSIHPTKLCVPGTARNRGSSSRGKVTELPLVGLGVSSFPFPWLLPVN